MIGLGETFKKIWLLYFLLLAGLILLKDNGAMAAAASEDVSWESVPVLNNDEPIYSYHKGHNIASTRSEILLDGKEIYCYDTTFAQYTFHCYVLINGKKLMFQDGKYVYELEIKSKKRKKICKLGKGCSLVAAYEKNIYYMEWGEYDTAYLRQYNTVTKQETKIDTVYNIVSSSNQYILYGENWHEGVGANDLYVYSMKTDEVVTEVKNSFQSCSPVVAGSKVYYAEVEIEFEESGVLKYDGTNKMKITCQDINTGKKTELRTIDLVAYGLVLSKNKLFFNESKTDENGNIIDKYWTLNINTGETKGLRNELYDKVRNKVGNYKSIESYYTDYDGDGDREAFFIVEKKSEYQLWFASKKQVKKIKLDTNFKEYIGVFWAGSGICKVSDKQKLFVAEGELIDGGGSSWSYCLYVKNGKAVKVEQKRLQSLHHSSGKQFAFYPLEYDSAYDGISTLGRTEKKYYLKWTGTRFQEYIGEQISLKQLKKYQGAENYIKQIKKLNYKIGKIYYRKNGIININVIEKGKDGWENYENVTLKVKGKKAALVEVDKKGTNIIEKSSYNGIYKARGLK